MPNLASEGAAKRERRLSLRITEQERLLIEQAALLTSSGDVTRFVVNACVSSAREAIESLEVTRVSMAMRETLYELLLNPPLPSTALARLAQDPVPPSFELVEE